MNAQYCLGSIPQGGCAGMNSDKHFKDAPTRLLSRPSRDYPEALLEALNDIAHCAENESEVGF